EQVTVECLQIRPGPRPLVHFTGEEAPDGLSRCALCCLPAPGFRREETAGPAREVPFLPNPRLRRLQDYRGRSVFSLLDSLPHWSGSPPKSFFFQRNLVSYLCNKARIYLLFIHLPASPFFFFDCHPSFWRKIEYVFFERCCTSLLFLKILY
uniref:Uncharacterized protein n=1 Tax=Ailuropoda melanoleuca TaxID=9646 RepID=A0A7N5JWM4_AILME